MNGPVVTLLKELMGVVSTSEEKHAIGSFLQKRLESLGYKVDRISISPGSSRCNIYAYVHSPKTRVCLTAHMDTVPPHSDYSYPRHYLRAGRM